MSSFRKESFSHTRLEPTVPGLLRRMPDTPRRIAILKAARIGDFLSAIPAFTALRKAVPQADIAMITLPMLKELVDRISVLDRFIPFPGYPGLAEQLFDPRNTLEFFSKMQSEQFDLVIQMQGSGVYANPFMFMLGAKYSAGFIRSGDPPGLLDAALPLPEEGHEIDRMLALTRFLGAPDVEPKVEFNLWQEDHHAAEDLLSDATHPLIGIHTMARDSTRRWELSRFAQTAYSLQKEYGGTILAIGEQAERTQVDQALYATGGSFINLCGLTSLPVTAAIIQRLSVFISNDTGPAHIAYALSTPTVSIFGGADPLRYGPKNQQRHRLMIHPVACRPCDYDECPIGKVCLDQIQVEQVIQAAREIIRVPVQNYG